MAQQTPSNGTIAGYFENRSDAERAITALQDAGFTSAHVGVAHRADSASTTATSTAHAVAGEAEGMWGKVKDFFGTGDSVEPYADEKQAGDLASHEVTPGYKAPYAEDLGDTMSGMSVDKDRSRYLSHKFGSSENGIVVTVTAAGREAQAESILEQYGADLGHTAAEYDYSAATAAPVAAAATTQGSQNIQLLGEALRVHKDRISRGEVTFRKEVITDMQTIQVPVTREELVIERHAVNDGTAVAGTIGDNSVVRIPLSEERASIDKSTFVREEVSIGKREVEATRQLSGEVRHEELIVEDKTETSEEVAGTPARKY